MIIDNYPASGEGECMMRYISLDAIDEELLYFLDKCISGVGKIIDELRKCTYKEN